MAGGLAPTSIRSQQSPLHLLNYRQCPTTSDRFRYNSRSHLPQLTNKKAKAKRTKPPRSSLPDQEADSNKDEIIFDSPGFFRIYKDGRAERFRQSGFVPPLLDDPSTGVSSKDVVIDSQTGLSARLYVPKGADRDQQNKRIPLLIYIHGCGFCMESAFSPFYHPYLNSLVAQANVVAVSVEYRLAPEHPLPAAYDDSWAALQWAISKEQEEEWLNKYADFDSVFMAGDSAGSNIAHNVVMRAGLNGLRISGVVLFYPFFSGVESVGSEVTSKLWSAVCPGTIGSDDPRFNPVKDPNFSRLGCKRVLVCVAEKDALRDRGRLYYEELQKTGWNGVAEFMEAKGEDYLFHLLYPACESAKELMKRVVLFLNTPS